MPNDFATFSTRAGDWTAEIDLNLSGLEGLYEDATEVSKEIAKLIIDQWADEVEDWMKANAPWQDDTGDARKSLGVLKDFTKQVWEMVLTGGVPYMKFLEMLHEYRFAILRPALDEWANVLIERLGAVRD